MSNAIRAVHRANKEVNTDDFDAVVEQGHMERLTRNDTVKVGLVIGLDLAYAVHGGKVGVCRGYTKDPGMNGCYLVQYRRGKMIHADGQVGEPRDFGPFLLKFYHRDRIAEILRLDMEEVA